MLKSLNVKRSDAELFNTLYDQSVETCSEFDLDEIKVPRIRQPPKRFSGSATAFQTADVHPYFSVEYYKLIDTVLSGLKGAVEQEETVIYGTLASCLLTRYVNEKCKEYPELDIDLLRIRLEMFHRQFAYSTVDETANVMRCHVPEVRKQFN